MDRRATTLLLQQLVTSGDLELEGDPDEALASLSEAATTWLAEHVGEPHCGHQFAVFLERHPCVAETYADDELLADKLAAWEHAVRRFAEPVAHRDPLLEQQIVDSPDDDELQLVRFVVGVRLRLLLHTQALALLFVGEALALGLLRLRALALRRHHPRQDDREVVERDHRRRHHELRHDVG